MAPLRIVRYLSVGLVLALIVIGLLPFLLVDSLTDLYGTGEFDVSLVKAFLTKWLNSNHPK
ncbi:hypothetical protein [Cohnella caldifontis]|uniref:hypothetical protein n=1 Tax=Cohnella caldifontis TaxID=3027471 RepID=UPI0023EB8DA7|nr:hypothetical protein [Cohnella sp. YIM B05605]